MSKYTRKSALQVLSRNGVEVKRVKKTPKATEKNPSPKSYILHIIFTRGLGIKSQGVCDYLINNFYDMARA